MFFSVEQFWLLYLGIRAKWVIFVKVLMGITLQFDCLSKGQCKMEKWFPIVIFKYLLCYPCSNTKAETEEKHLGRVAVVKGQGWKPLIYKIFSKWFIFWLVCMPKAQYNPEKSPTGSGVMEQSLQNEIYKTGELLDHV